MRRRFSLPVKPLQIKNPRVVARLAIGVLLLANVVVALIAFHPWGGSAEDLERQRQQLNRQVLEMQSRLARSKALVSKVEAARRQGDEFLARYILERRTTFSTMVEELSRTAKEAGIKPKEASNILEPVEGSEDLTQMTITAGFEGSYANLTRFINLLDKSPRFLIIESMVVSPQQASQNLNVSFKLDTFLREMPGGAL